VISATSPHTQAIACRSSAVSLAASRALASRWIMHRSWLGAHMAVVPVRADAIFLLVTPIKVVVQDVGHHVTSGGFGSGIHDFASNRRPLTMLLKNGP
jgi:hypothetical protein